MANLLLIVLLVGLIVIAAIFIAVAWKCPRTAKWLGLVTILASAPIFFWLGVFAEQFGAGICYSDTMDMIANAVEKTDAPRELSKQIRALPMHGYETSCSNVEAAAQKLPDADAP